jgi:hypothetical protein
MSFLLYLRRVRLSLEGGVGGPWEFLGISGNSWESVCPQGRRGRFSVSFAGGKA